MKPFSCHPIILPRYTILVIEWPARCHLDPPNIGLCFHRRALLPQSKLIFWPRQARTRDAKYVLSWSNQSTEIQWRRDCLHHIRMSSRGPMNREMWTTTHFVAPGREVSGNYFIVDSNFEASQFGLQLLSYLVRALSTMKREAHLPFARLLPLRWNS